MVKIFWAMSLCKVKAASEFQIGNFQINKSSFLLSVVITLANHKGHKTIHLAGSKRGKACASESRLVLAFLLFRQ